MWYSVFGLTSHIGAVTCDEVLLLYANIWPATSPIYAFDSISIFWFVVISLPVATVLIVVLNVKETIRIAVVVMALKNS